jgi:glycosyltransferase involved in cell wall biosynthesis
MLLAARMAARRLRGTRVVFTLQDTRGWMLSPAVKALQRWAYRGADRIFVTSQGFESGFLRRFDLLADGREVVFVPNVPPAGLFADLEPRASGRGLTVGCVGFLRGREGIEMLYQAARRARDAGADVRLLFAGKGSERDMVEELAEDGGFVDYAGPYRYERDIRGIYAQVDALYAIYDWSYDKQIHLAYRLCEAVNCRLPVIVAEGTHMAEVVRRHDVGVSVRLGDVEGLAQALAALSASPARRREIAANCRRVRPRFTFEYYEERIMEAYDTLWDGWLPAGGPVGGGR